MFAVFGLLFFNHLSNQIFQLLASQGSLLEHCGTQMGKNFQLLGRSRCSRRSL